MKKIIKTADAPKPVGPYSQAVDAGGFVYVSGQIPVDPHTGEPGQGDIKEQTKLVMENAKVILVAAGCNLAKVLKTTIYLKSMADLASVNEAYAEYFPADPPARSIVEVSNLPNNASLEMDFVAAR
jgi:2-iminobutanoate/2-iminopropanoate deaminase